MTTPIVHGDYVETDRHGYTGRAYKFEHLTNDDAEWVAAQNIPLTIENIQERFVSILVHKGGAVLVPESSCTKIDPIDGFEHRDMEDVFPSAPGKYKHQQFYIMKAYHLTTSGRKLGLKKIAADEPNCTVLVANRNHGMGKVRAFIIGSGHGYDVFEGQIHGYTIDTGNGHKGSDRMEILDVIEIRDGVITKGSSDHENASTWVMK